ncbi:MAG: polyprenol monophosphomannose synthase [Aureliella sp.]
MTSISEHDGPADSRAPQQPRVLVLFCTYNERQNLPEVLAAIWDVMPQADVLVMDDNSPDGTGAWARQAQTHEPRLFVEVRAGKLGLGSALRDGIAWCLAREYDFWINHDADQSHDPRAAGRLLAPCVASPERSVVAIGSRYVPGGASTGLSLWRQSISRLLNWYATALLRLPVRDCSGSYRCYSVRLLRKLDLAQLRCNGYGFLEEILVHLARMGAHFTEVPITYHARGSGSSKLGLSDAWGALVVIHRLAFRGIAAKNLSYRD